MKAPINDFMDEWDETPEPNSSNGSGHAAETPTGPSVPELSAESRPIPPKPAVLPLNIAGIPAELRALKAWVGWRLVWNPKKNKGQGGWDKVPVNLKTGGLAASDDPTTWCDFNFALGNYKRCGCDGIGLCRTDDQLFIDLDGCLDADGNLLRFSWASDTLDALRGKAYLEKSPSGTGAHAIVIYRGRLPPGRRQFDEPGHDHTGVALYDGNRYFTFTGRELPQSGPITDCTEKINRLYASLFPPKPKLNGSGNGHHAAHAAAPLSLSDSELLEKAFRAANGDKFRALWSGNLSYPGDYPSPSEADMALCCELAFWTGNDASRIDALFRQSGLYREKWERDDYRERTIQRAIENTPETFDPNHSHPRTESSYVVNVVSVVPPADEQESGAAYGKSEGASETTKSTGANWPQALRDEAFHGVAGELVRAIEPHSEADPAAILIQFLVAFGNLIGRFAHFVVEADRHFMNLFIVLVGLTAKGRKGTSLGQVLRVLNTVDSEWKKSRIMNGLASGEALIWAARDEIRERVPIRQNQRVVDYEEVVTDQGEKDKRLLIVEPEFARILQVSERETNTLSAILRQAWDDGNLQNRTKKQAALATEAHVSCIGHVTKDELRRRLTDTAMGNGFANRYLYVCTRRSKRLPEGGALGTVDFGPIMRQIQTAVDFARGVGEMQRDEEARSLWREVYAELSEGKPGLLGSVTSRAEAQVRRIESIYALQDCSAVVRAEHLAAALAVWQYCEDSARFIFGDALGDATGDEILRALRNRPAGMTRTEVRDYFSKNKRAADLDRALSMLQEYGRARVVQEGTGGRPAERWFAV